MSIFSINAQTSYYQVPGLIMAIKLLSLRKGGYRIYFFVVLCKDDLYLLFLHPKTGADGASNITNEAKAKLLKLVVEAIKTQKLFSVSTDKEKKELIFSEFS
ncbi:hypothetical protein RCC89_20695 [Cytophagaceae bacterium ABcell3]|nr:hypothetical protein RCC89_20695 [Cytophagaceae bacterium ABcell3]